MRVLFACLLLVSSSTWLQAQTITLISIDTSAYPTVRANYSALDPNGVVYTDLKASDFGIVERTKNSKSFNLDASITQGCTKTTTNAPVSLLIIIDVSSSMRQMVNGVQRITLVKNALNKVIGQMTLAQGSQLCVLAFSSSTRIVCNWTSDLSIVTTAISNITISGGTKYDLVFFGNPNIFQEFRKTDRSIPRSAIFITDGQPSTIKDTAAFVVRATDSLDAQSITLHSVYTSDKLDPTYPPLVHVCTNTGGTAVNGTDDAFATMIEAAGTAATATLSCSIAWESPYSCDPADFERTAEITLRRGTRPTTLTAYGSRQRSTEIRAALGNLVGVSPGAKAFVPFSVSPIPTAFGPVNRLTIDLTYPPDLLNFVESVSRTSRATIVSTDTKTRGHVLMTVDVMSPFNEDLFFTSEFESMLTHDSIAHLTTNVQTDNPCVTTAIESGDLLVSLQCAGSRRVVNHSVETFSLTYPSPNPANDFLLIAYSTGYTTSSAFEIVDAMGNVVKTIHVGEQPSSEYTAQLMLHDLPPGAYVLRMHAGHFVGFRNFHVVR